MRPVGAGRVTDAETCRRRRRSACKFFQRLSQSPAPDACVRVFLHRTERSVTLGVARRVAIIRHRDAQLRAAEKLQQARKENRTASAPSREVRRFVYLPCEE